MRLRTIYTISICLLCFTSCNHTTRPTEFARAEALMESRPDSALRILEKHSLHDYTNPEAQAQYALLLTQAKDKNYITHTSDSLIRIAVRYYDSGGDVAMQAKAHYYLGRVYQDKDDIVGTVREFLIATPLAEKTEDYNMRCLLKSNLGYLLWNNGLLDEADSLYHQAIQLESAHHDVSRLAVALTKCADIAMQRQKPNYVQAERYLKQALFLTLKFDNANIREKILSSLSTLYLYMNKPQVAIYYAKKGISLMSDSSQAYGYYIVIGSAYNDMKYYDSAIVYLKKSLPADNYYTKEGAYRILAKIAGKQGRARESINYNDNI